MKIMDLLFGKKPRIFNKKGEVEHHLSEEKWRAYRDRYLQSTEHNWKRHEGTGFKKPPPAPERE